MYNQRLHNSPQHEAITSKGTNADDRAPALAGFRAPSFSSAGLLVASPSHVFLQPGVILRTATHVVASDVTPPPSALHATVAAVRSREVPLITSHRNVGLQLNAAQQAQRSELPPFQHRETNQILSSPPLPHSASPPTPQPPPTSMPSSHLPPIPPAPAVWRPTTWTVFWDLENVRIPRATTVAHFVHTISNFLSTLRNSTNPEPITRIHAVGNLHRITPHQRPQLHANGVSLLHTQPTRQRKDVADKALLTDIAMLPLITPPPHAVAILTGDVDFAYCVSRLVALTYFTVVIAPSHTSCSPLLAKAPHVIVYLSELLQTVGPLPQRVYAPHRETDGVDVRPMTPARNNGASPVKRDDSVTQTKRLPRKVRRQALQGVLRPAKTPTNNVAFVRKDNGTDEPPATRVTPKHPTSRRSRTHWHNGLGGGNSRDSQVTNAPADENDMNVDAGDTSTMAASTPVVRRINTSFIRILAVLLLVVLFFPVLWRQVVTQRVK